MKGDFKRAIWLGGDWMRGGFVCSVCAPLVDGNWMVLDCGIIFGSLVQLRIFFEIMYRNFRQFYVLREEHKERKM